MAGGTGTEDQRIVRLLAIETSGRTFSVALSENGKLVSEIYLDEGRVHSEKLVPSIKKLLAGARWRFNSLDKIAVSTGPGSFTGIRVGLTCARLLAQALKRPVVGINTLELLESAVPEGDYTAVAAIDAGRGEVFVNACDPRIEEAKTYFAELKRSNSKILVAGDAAATHSDVIKSGLKKMLVKTPERLKFPRAGVLAVLASQIKGLHYEKVKPLYIRRSWAEENK